MKAVLVAAMLVAAAVGGGIAPARAGAVGDALVAAGGWIAEVESAVSGWIDRLWNRVATSHRTERAADAFRQLVVESPGQLDALAGRAGYALATYAVARGDHQDLVLRFRHDRDLDPAERLTLSRELADPAAFDVRPELELLRILLDAADWRDAGAGTRFLLTGVEVQVDDRLSSRLIFTEPMVQR